MRAHIIVARNVNDALESGLHWLAAAGSVKGSRNGTVLVAPGPVITEYTHPWERVLLSPLRDANPFFHLYECIWMLAGRNDSASVARYAKHMDTFAEEGKMNGAYGHRWREHFGYDQLLFLEQELRQDPGTRRAVLTMWDAGFMVNTDGDQPGDPHKARAGSKDVPCNTHVYFSIVNGALDMTVCNRSNDVVWGAYGANAVHMSFLQEVLACSLGVPMGRYYQVSNNFHAYVGREDVQRLLGARPGPGWNVKYSADMRIVGRVPLGSFELHEFLLTCERYAKTPTLYAGGGAFMADTFIPMMKAHAAYKEARYGDAMAMAKEVVAEDWRTAAVEWLERREARRAVAA